MRLDELSGKPARMANTNDHRRKALKQASEKKGALFEACWFDARRRAVERHHTHQERADAIATSLRALISAGRTDLHKAGRIGAREEIERAVGRILIEGL